jgi:hypothetical protein
MVGALFIYTIALLKELSDMFPFLCIDNFSIIFCWQWRLCSHTPFLAFICAIAFDSLITTISLPITSITSKMPGLAVFPVRATLNGWATVPSFIWCVSTKLENIRSSSSCVKASAPFRGFQEFLIGLRIIDDFSEVEQRTLGHIKQCL